MYTYVAKNLITVAIYKCVLKSLRFSQRASMRMLQEPPIFCNLHSTYDVIVFILMHFLPFW